MGQGCNRPKAGIHGTHEIHVPALAQLLFRCLECQPRMFRNPRGKFDGWGLANVRDESMGSFGRGWEFSDASVAMLSPRAFPLHVLPKAWTPGTNGAVDGDAILAKLDEAPKRWDLATVKRMIVGGSAAPAAMIAGFSERHGITIVHAWGMTETSPIGSVANLRPVHDGLDAAGKLAVRASQGLCVPFVEMRHVKDDGAILPWDGTSMGELEVRGPWVTGAYLGGDGKDRFTADGWFKTGDVVTLDPDGTMRICDRSKDVIKSGGEWISSVELENALMAHPDVLEAAVFAGRHPKWDERPIAAIVWKPGREGSFDALRAHLEGKFAKFWMPDLFVAVDAIPKTSVGKIQKSALRERFKDQLA